MYIFEKKNVRMYTLAESSMLSLPVGPVCRVNALTA
jgi:hypothetical protein